MLFKFVYPCLLWYFLAVLFINLSLYILLYVKSHNRTERECKGVGWDILISEKLLSYYGSCICMIISLSDLV